MHMSVWDDDVITRASSSSGSSGVVQAVWTLPLHSVVLISNGEFPLDDVTESFWRKPPVRAWEWERQKNGNESNRNDTHYPVDAVFTHGSLGHHHQVRLNAPFLQVLAALSSVPRLHIKLSMQTLQGILGDVHSPTRHTCDVSELKHTTSCFTHYTTLVDNCCFTAQNYRDNSLTGFRIHSWTLFDSLK